MLAIFTVPGVQSTDGLGGRDGTGWAPPDYSPTTADYNPLGRLDEMALRLKANVWQLCHPSPFTNGMGQASRLYVQTSKKSEENNWQITQKQVDSSSMNPQLKIATAMSLALR